MPTSANVPGRVPVGIDGHEYMAEAAITRQTVPVLRQQADTSTEAGEQSLNPQGLWRRSQESWHHGAGQTFLDGKQSDEPTDPHRFRSSTGIDVWTKGQISLLNETMRSWSSTNTNLRIVVAGQVALIADGTEVYSTPLPFTMLNSLAMQTGNGWTITNGTAAPGATSSRMQITATAAGSVTAVSPQVTAIAGRVYKASYVSNYVSGGAGRIPTIAIRWYRYNGTPISTSALGTSGPADTTSSSAFVTATAPAETDKLAVEISWTTAWAAGEIHGLYGNVGPSDTLGVNYTQGWHTHGINAGQAPQTVQSIATDGVYVWAALGTSGLHRTIYHTLSSTSDVPAAPAGGQISLVGYANGILLAAGSSTSTTAKNVLWRVDNPLTTPTLVEIKTHPNPSFAWTGIATGRNCAYAFGNNGSNGEVYKIMLDATTGVLSSAASFATYLPEGETINALYFYAGGVILGTGRGVRIGQADGAGNIDYGPLIATEWAVNCLEPQGRYCWFGWTKYDAVSSGLGRIDLGYLTDTLTPAWASDLMSVDTTQGDVLSCATLAPFGYTSSQRPPIRLFSVAGSGVYVEDASLRRNLGDLRTGTIRFGTSEPKLTRSIDVRHHAMPTGGAVHVSVNRDQGAAWSGLDYSADTPGSYGPATPLTVGPYTVESLEFMFVLERPDPAGTNFSRTPEMTRWTVKALPKPSTIDETFEIPILMRAETKTGQGDGAVHYIDVAAEIAYLKNLERTRTLITLQVGAETIPDCYIAASSFKQDVWGDGRAYMEGIYTVQVMTARG